jgi:hypothetical protein
MTRPILFAAALLSASPAGARAPGPLPRTGAPHVPADCTITAAFGSYAAGIDGATLARMERTLDADSRVRNVTRHPWGREGEVTLCIRTRTLAGADALSRELRAMIPARPRGPISVVLVPGRLY